MSGRPGRMPDLVPPMQVATASGEPPTGQDWVVEVAWTGHRCVAYVQPGSRVRLLSANARPMGAAYPELARPLLARAPGRGMVLDGTLVARGEEWASRPRLLGRRSSRSWPSERTIERIPVDYQVADLLWLDGHSTLELPYRDRRSLLDGLGLDSEPVWATSTFPAGELGSIMGLAGEKGIEALHVRHLGGRYRAGGRSRFWLRVPVQHTRQVIVGGWTPTVPGRPETVGTLLLGVPGAAGLDYVGRVGVAQEERRRLAGELAARRAAATPFASAVPADAARHASWLRPDLVGSAEFAGWLADGRLRLPRWRGLLAPERVDPARFARPPRQPDVLAEQPGRAGSAPQRPGQVALRPPAGPPQAAAVQVRRLEQHFVYNALNTIAALIRTDPARARDLLLGFADLSRAADLPPDTPSTLGRELEAVRGYLQLEQARFGARLRVQLDVDPALHATPAPPLRLLAAVRDAVQQGIEPRPGGGLLRVSASPGEPGGATVAVTVAVPDAPPTVIVLLAQGSPARSG